MQIGIELFCLHKQHRRESAASGARVGRTQIDSGNGCDENSVEMSGDSDTDNELLFLLTKEKDVG